MNNLPKKELHQLLSGLPRELAAKTLHGRTEGEVVRVTRDSRKAGPGCIFVAVKGSKVDGHDFVHLAAKQGCVCVVVEDDPGPLEHAAVVQVADSRSALAWLSAALHGFPSRSMTMIGLTGTNGKTTISWLVEQMLHDAGHRVGVIGTVNYRHRDRMGRLVEERAPLTTPEPEQLQRLLRTMADDGVTHVVMEASSHALEQGRLDGVCFDVAMFSNLSRDHLDFHGSMEAYFAAKKLLFSRHLKEGGQAVVVVDSSRGEEDWGRRLCHELSAQGLGPTRLLTCGLAEAASVSAAALRQDIGGFSCQLRLDGQEHGFASRLVGRHNVLNILAAAGIGLALGMNSRAILFGLGRDRQVPGRLERVRLPGADEDEQPCVLVDYAHTPDALQNVLQTLRPLAAGRLICVFGCGGDRDRGKRPLMGAVAVRLADVAVATSDNPRSEDPEEIVRQVAKGCQAAGAREVDAAELPAAWEADQPCFVRILDRRAAVQAACALAGPGDIVLLAGKGHEDYQIVGQERLFFDDRMEALDGLLRWNVRHLLKAVQGEAKGGQARQMFGRISTDTRTLAAGDVFVALSGERFEGHDYVRAAAAAGAGAVIVRRDAVLHDVPEQVVVVRVADTQQALLDLAAHRRRLLRGRLTVAAITGSCGKTTVKELTAAIFSRHCTTTAGSDPVLKTRGNFNNLTGMPLSLLPAAASHVMAVLEMGMNQPGEIARLVAAADPDIACITNVHSAHLEGLGSIEGVARAKGELFAGLRPDSVSVVNFDDPHVRRLSTRSERIVGFAATPAGCRRKPVVRATRIVDCGETGTRFTLHVGPWKQRISVRLPGWHSVSNCCAAAAVAHAAGIPPEAVAAALADFQGGADKRMQFMALPSGIQVLNDCYNANPASMSAALRTVQSFGRDCQRIALLGDMLELGSAAEAAHEAVGREAAALGYDQLAVVGCFAGMVAQGAGLAGMAKEKIHVFADVKAMARWLHDAIASSAVMAGDWLLIKGSRGMRMEGVLEEMQHMLAAKRSSEAG